MQTRTTLGQVAAEALSALADSPIDPRPDDGRRGRGGLSKWQLAVHSAVHSDAVQQIAQSYDGVEATGDAPALRRAREALVEACVEAMPEGTV